MGKKCDFSGWATRANVLCSDGRVIMPGAFKHCDGIKVPLVWNHKHDSPLEVLGHVVLEHRDEGVYAYGTFNDTDSGQTAKLLVQNGDVDRLSIYANKLKQSGKNVLHGAIREVSLVLAGANPEAMIDVVMAHGDDPCSEDHIVGVPGNIEYAEDLFHAETEDEEKKGDKEVADNNEKQTPAESEETIKEIFNTLTSKQKTAVYAILGQILGEEKNDGSDKDVKHADEEEPAADGEETVKEVFETLTPKQKDAVYAIVADLMEEKDGEDDDVEHSEIVEGDYDAMKHNVWDQTETKANDVLAHSEMVAIIDDAKRNGSLKDAVLAHSIEDIEIMFPDAKTLTNEPAFIKRKDDWVAKVLGGVHHSPFARIKTIFADITGAQARAKGYVKGKQKIEEVFKLLKRVTNPTTIYKKQALDRDDVIDITDFNILPWLKKEIRMMWDEELARAILIGDGRDPVEEADDKIDEECIRPIWKMEDLFTVKHIINVTADATADERASAFIDGCIKSRKNYRGSGNPVMFMAEDTLTDCLLLKDKNGRYIYDTVANLAARLRVSEIITAPVLEGVKRTDEDNNEFELAGLYVNLKDYNIGTDKGGELNFFDDFDIDFNKMKYLMEGRCSGTLVVPYSAVAIEFTTEAQG